MRELTAEQKRLKRKYPVVTFRTLKMLRLHKMTDAHIYTMYGIKPEVLKSFEKNHMQVLRKARNWA